MAQSLSSQLRAHEEIEALLCLPGAIQTHRDYSRWLERFLGLYEPLESRLAAFAAWDALGLEQPLCNHTSCLVEDLGLLGTSPAATQRASHLILPELPSFAHAIGALYVLEGSALGARVILRAIEGRIPLVGATKFFGGRGTPVGPTWQDFRAALDRFGREQPLRMQDTLTGAERTFQSMIAWFAPFCAVREGRP